MKLNFTNKKHL